MTKTKALRKSKHPVEPGVMWEQTDKNGIAFRCTAPRSTTGWEQWYLIASDVHFDSTHCDRKLWGRYLDEAVERNAPVIIVGDFFDVMQGKGDPRASLNGLDPSFRTIYFNNVLEQATEFHAKYAKILAVVGQGNHEYAVADKYGNELLSMWARYMVPHGANMILPGYEFYLRFFVRWGNVMQSKTACCWHGSGGGGPVTRDTIGKNREMLRTTCNYAISGHTHDAWAMKMVSHDINSKGKVTRTIRHAIKTGHFKMRGGWEIQKGIPDKARGAVWLRHYLHSNELREEFREGGE